VIKLSVFALLLGVSQGMFSQTDRTVHLSFMPSATTSVQIDSVGNLHEIDVFRCYLSDFDFLKNGKVVWAESASFHLLDMNDSTTMDLSFNIPIEIETDSFRFRLGIDSLTSVSGAYGGDLDPTRGMYWTWNNGYIHWKIEGHSLASSAPDGAFEFHLGGYQSPYATSHLLSFKPSDIHHVKIDIDLGGFLDAVDMQSRPRLMSPGKDAFELSKLAVKTFKLRQ